jgi:hypothetical protein
MTTYFNRPGYETANHRSNLLRKGVSDNETPLIKPQVASNVNSTPAVNWRTDISPIWHPSDDPSQWFVTINGEEVNPDDAEIVFSNVTRERDTKEQRPAGIDKGYLQNNGLTLARASMQIVAYNTAGVRLIQTLFNLAIQTNMNAIRIQSPCFDMVKAEWFVIKKPVLNHVSVTEVEASFELIENAPAQQKPNAINPTSTNAGGNQDLSKAAAEVNANAGNAPLVSPNLASPDKRQTP